MKKIYGSILILATMAATSAKAQQVGQMRVLACEGPDAKMEVYLPNAVISDGKFVQGKVKGVVLGSYVLDLTDAGKGKIAEPVRVSLSADKKSVIVNQYTRKLPPTVIPLKGGTVNFDNRFGTNAKCSAFGSG